MIAVLCTVLDMVLYQPRQGTLHAVIIVILKGVMATLCVWLFLVY
jgi:hypothetical protein